MKDRDTNKPKLNARNWECGVVIPVDSTTSTSSPNGASVRGTRWEAETLKEVFNGGVVPIPMELPGLPYQNLERRPWFSDEA